MTHKLVVKNFKSLKNVDIPCKKINVFIGEPNSGKSNIIEALSLMSQAIVEPAELSKEVIRYKSIGDLFFDFNINRPIEIFTDQLNCEIEYVVKNGIPINEFELRLYSPIEKHKRSNATFRLKHDGRVTGAVTGDWSSTNFRFYEYKRLHNFTSSSFSPLSVPYGNNLPSLLLSNEDYKNWVIDFFQSKGFILTLKPTENDINVSKLVNNQIYSYPYYAISETLQRVVFYTMAVKSNKESIILFDEPESNTFPFYTKFLAELIALDESNQFFITTHNPYLLLNLIEKSSIENINVFVARMKNYETQMVLLTKEQLGEVLDLNSDVFLNLDRIID